MVKKASVEWHDSAGLGDVLTLVPRDAVGQHVVRRHGRRLGGRAAGVPGRSALRRREDGHEGARTTARAHSRRNVPLNGEILERDFYERDPKLVARQLLNKVLVHGNRSARLVEVEAYCGAIDPGSHAFRGKTKRNATMFGPAGGLYVYFTYGMHWCANAVCGDVDEGARRPAARGAAAHRARRDARVARPIAKRDRDLCSGPAKLCQAFGLDRAHDGADLVTGDRGVVIVDDGVPPPRRPGNSVRIGLSAGAEHPWRWYVDGDPNVSEVRPRTASRRPPSRS